MRPYNRQINNDFVNRMMIQEIRREEQLTSVLEEHFGDDAWQDWADFCRVYPEFRYFSRGIDHQKLHLQQNEIPSSALINIFEYVKKASIVLNQNHQLNIASHYEKLSNVNQLYIYNVKSPINFITSLNIIQLFVSNPYDSRIETQSNFDLVLPILRISEKISNFGYNGGALTYASMLYLTWNPIETLLLKNVTITDNYAFTEFLSNAPFLINLFLTGNKQLDAQIGFFHNANKARHQIKYLAISFNGILLTEYGKITECLNLTYFVLYYTYYDDIENLLPFLLELPNLKHVELCPKFAHVDQESHNERESMINRYERIFLSRDISLIRGPPAC